MYARNAEKMVMFNGISAKMEEKNVSIKDLSEYLRIPASSIAKVISSPMPQESIDRIMKAIDTISGDPVDAKLRKMTSPDVMVVEKYR